MSIHKLPNNHLQLTCDACSNEIVKHGISEDELLDRAEELGWNVEREFGLHYCPLTTVYECDICGAPTRSGITDVSSGEATYYCREHWPY
jgi:hypothetical protein